MKSCSTGGREEDPSVQGHVAASVSLLPSPRLSYAATQACVCLVLLVLSLLLLTWAQVKHPAVPWLLPAATALSRRSQAREMPEVQVFAPWAAFGPICFWSLEVGVLFQFMPRF